jgi:uncharacterized membrane protein
MTAEMSENNDQIEEKPFAAPCARLDWRAPPAWVACGWRDFRASLRVSLIYGALIFALSLAVVGLAWKMGSYVLVLAMLSGFVFVAPVLATGLYSVSRQASRGEKPSFRRSINRMRLVLGNALVFTLVLLVIFLIWARAASMVHIFYPAQDQGWLGLLPFLVIGSAVGSIFALIVFSAAAFSLPMIVDRDVDMVTACVTSINAVLRNKPAMGVWCGLIAGMTALAFLTFGVGLMVVIPVLGYATYHGYQQTIDASDWPENPTAP